MKEINTIIKYIPLQQGLRLSVFVQQIVRSQIIKYIPLQQGLRLFSLLYCANASGNY